MPEQEHTLKAVPLIENHNSRRYVVHFDLLGMKNAIVRDEMEAWGALCDLNACRKEASAIVMQIQSTGKLISDRVRTFIFSDTVIMFSYGDEEVDLWATLVLASELFGKAFNSCVPIRGGVALGDFRFNLDENLFAGSAHVRAYELAETAQWLGIVVDEQVGELAGHLPLGNKIIRHDVPLKNGQSLNQAVIDWPVIFANNWKASPPITMPQFYQAFEPLFGPYASLPVDAKRKWENTLDFVNARLESLATSPPEGKNLPARSADGGDGYSDSTVEEPSESERQNEEHGDKQGSQLEEGRNTLHLTEQGSSADADSSLQIFLSTLRHVTDLEYRRISALDLFSGPGIILVTAYLSAVWYVWQGTTSIMETLKADRFAEVEGLLVGVTIAGVLGLAALLFLLASIGQHTVFRLTTMPKPTEAALKEPSSKTTRELLRWYQEELDRVSRARRLRGAGTWVAYLALITGLALLAYCFVWFTELKVLYSG